MIYNRLDYNFIWSSSLRNISNESMQIEHDTLVILNKAIMSENMDLLSEANEVQDKKNNAKKLTSSVKEIWNKFSNNVKDVTDKNQDWLANYRDKILSSNPTINYSLYDYTRGNQIMDATKLPRFAPNNPAFLQSLDTEEVFMEKYFRNMVVNVNKLKGNNKELDNNTAIKRVFRGNKVIDYKGPTLKAQVAEMYNYCTNYRANATKLKQDYNEIMKACNELIRVAGNNTSMDVKDAKIAEDYINFIKGFILAEDEELATVRSRNSESLSGKNPSNVNEKASVSTNNDGTDYNKNDSLSNNSPKDRQIKTYISVCQRILSSKMSIMEERYNESIKLLRFLAKGGKAEKVENPENKQQQNNNPDDGTTVKWTKTSKTVSSNQQQNPPK